MKKTILILAVALLSYGANAQTNTLPSSGNVGIGTTSPSALLSVGFASPGSSSPFQVNSAGGISGPSLTIGSGTVSLGSLGTGGRTYIGGNAVDDGTGSVLQIQQGNSSNAAAIISALSNSNIGLIMGGYTTLGGYINGYNSSGSGTSNLLLNLNGGNVGIGTTNPNGQLSLNNQISNTSNSNNPINYTATSGVTGQAIFNSYYVLNSDGAGTYPRYLDVASVGAPDGTNGGSNIRFLTNPIATSSPAIERMRINSNGNVGIGTTSPSTYGALAVRSAVSLNSKNVSASFSDASNSTLDIRHPAVSVDDISSQNSVLSFSTNTSGTDGVERMRITTTGNVLIGQTSQVNSAYKLDIAGSERANEIVVNTTGADFVFDNKYSLPKLSEVKSYIDINHHLPEIPSAEQMKKDGLSVGEMNTKLLQKVEELTLYLIEKDKQLSEQQKATQSQQEQINQLKEQLASLTKALTKN